MTDNLPPLPEARKPDEHGAGWFTAAQMQAYARAAIAQAQSLPDGYNPMKTAPRDGTIVRLLVEFEDNPLENDNSKPLWTIGGNSFENTGEELWQFAGWNWTHDCFVDGIGKPIGWLPLVDAASPQPQPVQPITVHCYKHDPDEPVSGCKYCDGKSAQAKPEQAAQPEKDPLHDDIQSVLFEVEQAIENGSCPWQIEAAFEAYEAARRLQLPDHGITAPQPKD